jgi:hypothetical protein
MNNKTKGLLDVLSTAGLESLQDAMLSLNKERLANTESDYLHRYERELALLEDHIRVVLSSVNNLHLRVIEEEVNNENN